jgi:hypothetical protein
MHITVAEKPIPAAHLKRDVHHISAATNSLGLFFGLQLKKFLRTGGYEYKLWSQPVPTARDLGNDAGMRSGLLPLPRLPAVKAAPAGIDLRWKPRNWFAMSRIWSRRSSFLLAAIP